MHCRWEPAAVELPPHGWAPATGAVPETLPFAVDRAGPAGSLPVYRDIRHGRTKIYTVVRKIRGDTEVRLPGLAVRLRAPSVPPARGRGRPPFQLPLPPFRPLPPFAPPPNLQAMAQELHKLCRGAPVTQRPGRIEVDGDHKLDVVRYLSGLGL